MTPLQKAEHLVLPPEFNSWMDYAEHYTRHAKCNKELMYTKRKLQTEYASDSPDSEYSFYKKITMYHEAHLEHYLRVLGEETPEHYWVGSDGGLDYQSEFGDAVETGIRFNLTTGAPATEKDAEEFIKLVN